MADKINLSLEKFLPELEVLVENKVFTRNEIKKIIKKRRQYEYTFERKDVTKADYFKAIKYEKILDKRRITKKKEMNLKKVTYYDFHCKIF